jgi:hypothetical protein
MSPGLFLIGLVAASPCFGALSYERFAHPKGDYVLDFPSDWKRSVGMETLHLRPSGIAGKLVEVSVEKHPLGREAATPAEFIAALLKDAKGLRRLDARDSIQVSGRDAERLTLTETRVLKGAYNTTLPGPMTETVVVVPFGKSFYVLRLRGVGHDLVAARPEFERLVSGFKLGNAVR